MKKRFGRMKFITECSSVKFDIHGLIIYVEYSELSEVDNII